MIPIQQLTKKIEDNLTTLDSLSKDSEDLSILIEEELTEDTKQLEDLKLQTYLSGEYDKNNCILEIHSGAGGTEACDWANMLLRMYQRYL